MGVAVVQAARIGADTAIARKTVIFMLLLPGGLCYGVVFSALLGINAQAASARTAVMIKPPKHAAAIASANKVIAIRSLR